MPMKGTKVHDLTQHARAGYDGNENSHLATSPAWYAHAIGRYLHDTGRAPPYAVSMSRGNSMNANGKRWRFSHPAPGRVEFNLIEG